MIQAARFQNRMTEDNEDPETLPGRNEKCFQVQWFQETVCRL